MSSVFVIKPLELTALNYLEGSRPVPVSIQWINRGTDQVLKRTSVDTLLRTLFLDMVSPSVVRLQRAAGLRAIFNSDSDRDAFAAALRSAKDLEETSRRLRVTAVFQDPENASRAQAAMKLAGLPVSSIAILSRPDQIIDRDVRWYPGHSRLSVAVAVAGSGLAAAILGIAMLAIPGLGLAGAAAGLTSSTMSSFAGVSSVFGSMGGAIARMLDDHDVDGFTAAYLSKQVHHGKVFMCIDTCNVEHLHLTAQQIVKRNGGFLTL